MPPKNSHKTAGFTLIELVLTLSVTSILLLSLMSVMRLLGKAAPSGTDIAQVAMDHQSALDRLRDDVAAATEVVTPAANRLAIVVPDRDGDLIAEQLLYAVDAAAGTLTLSVNGEPEHVLLKDISSPSFEYTIERTLDEIASSTASEPASVLMNNGTSVYITNDEVSNTLFVSQTLGVRLPADAISWRIPRIEIWGRRMDTSAPNVTLTVRNLSGTTPGTTIHQTANALLTGLSTTGYALSSFDFATPATFSPTQRVCMHLRTASATARYEVGSIAPAPVYDSTFAAWNGSAWSANNQKSIGMRVWVEVRRPAPTTINMNVLTAVDLRFTSATLGVVSTTMKFANLPEVP